MNGIPMPPAQTPEMLQCHSKLMDENSPVKKTDIWNKLSRGNTPLY